MKNFKGINNPNFKHDKTHNNKCIDCGKHISHVGIIRANSNRTYWENYYKEKLNKIIFDIKKEN